MVGPAVGSTGSRLMRASDAGRSRRCGLHRGQRPKAFNERNREIFGDRGRGAKVHAQHAREQATKAAREADAAECLLWSEQMEGSGGPAQPSPTLAQRRLRLARGHVQTLRNPRQPSARRHPPPARYADLETGKRVPVPILRDAALPGSGPHDQADEGAVDCAVCLDASG
jgi:hypothetical protein